ncbi:MAG: DUF4058 family protein [Thermoguttaceae bacterium]
MSMIFPGMNPYLEDPQIWPGVPSRLVVYLADQLQPMLAPRYLAAVEERVYIEGPDRQILPDVSIRPAAQASRQSGVAVAEVDDPVLVQVAPLEIRESYVEIFDLYSGQKVVTVIGVVSPSNKFPGPGRDSYQAKQREVLGSTAHLVEIDLLRTGQHVLAVPEWSARGKGPYDYLVCVNRAHGIRDRYELYLRGLRQRLPRVRIPLAGDDPDLKLDIQGVVAQVYQAGAYRQRINYREACRPPLGPEDQAWAHSLIAEHAEKQAPPGPPA